MPQAFDLDDFPVSESRQRLLGKPGGDPDPQAAGHELEKGEAARTVEPVK